MSELAWPMDRVHRAARGLSLLAALLGAELRAAEASSASPANPPAPCPASAVRLPVGADLAAVVGRAPEGASFCVAAGVHRMQTITPKDRQSFYGEPGAILNGSRQLTGFAREGRYWVTDGQRQHGWRRLDVPCIAARPRCGFPEAVFIDDRPLFHAASRNTVTGDSFFLDYDSGRRYLGVNPAGRRVEASVSATAFVGGARDVLISGLVVEKYASAAQEGAIGQNKKSEGWIIRDSVIRLNSAAGLLVGTRSQVLRNHIRDNGNMGAGCGGEDVLFEENEIARNGYFSGIEPLWEGGGVKCVGTTHLIFRRNRVEGNNGIGLWTDYDNIHTLYKDNLLLRNVNSGISHEVSYNAVIRGNYLYGNGDGFHVWLWGGAIQIQNSRNVLVQGNLVIAYAGNGISLIQQDRGVGRFGPFFTTGNKVFGNVVISMTANGGRSGAVADHDPEEMWKGKNTFAGNVYHVADPRAAYWAWGGRDRTWADYRASSGQDADSTLFALPAARAGSRKAQAR